MNFHCASKRRLWNRVACINPRHGCLKAGRTFCLLLARHCFVHMPFQLSRRILNDFFEFFIFRISEVNASQSSNIIEFCFFVCPFFFFLNGFLDFSPNLWPHMICSGSRLNCCQSLSGLHMSLWELFLSIE